MRVKYVRPVYYKKCQCLVVNVLDYLPVVLLTKSFYLTTEAW